MTLDVRTVPAVGQEFVRVNPSTIKFTQSDIKDRFQDGHTLLETAVLIARQDVGKRDIPMITVVRASDKRFYADNRRLAVFRVLEMCGKVRTIKVEVVPFTSRSSEWSRKMTTTTRGETIRVRQGNYKIGKALSDTSIPWLQQIRNIAPRMGILPDAQFSIFLATFTDE